MTRLWDRLLRKGTTMDPRLDMLAPYDPDPLSRCATLMRQQEAQEQADRDRAEAEAAAAFEDKMTRQAIQDRTETLQHGAPLRVLEQERQRQADQRSGRIAELRAELGRLDPAFAGDAPAAARMSLALPDAAGELTVSADQAAAMMPDAPDSLLARSAAEAAAWRSLLPLRRQAAEREHDRARAAAGRPARRQARREARPRPREMTRSSSASSSRPRVAPPLAMPEAAPLLPSGDY